MKYDQEWWKNAGYFRLPQPYEQLCISFPEMAAMKFKTNDQIENEYIEAINNALHRGIKDAYFEPEVLRYRWEMAHRLRNGWPPKEPKEVEELRRTLKSTAGIEIKTEIRKRFHEIDNIKEPAKSGAALLVLLTMIDELPESERIEAERIKDEWYGKKGELLNQILSSSGRLAMKELEIKQLKKEFEDYKKRRTVPKSEQEKLESKQTEQMNSLSATRKDELAKWAGRAKLLTVAIVFTDIVGSAKLCNDKGDAQWDQIRQKHFDRVEVLIHERNGFFIKDTGDGIIALFHSAVEAVDFGLYLIGNTGHPVVKVRVGIHVGQVRLEVDDVRGTNVNLASRIMKKAKPNDVITSDLVKRDITQRGEANIKQLYWKKLSNVKLKGFPKSMKLWRVANIV